ncbi:MAG: ChbG/HpnK family deacetylase [Thermoguttaceae bacterium]|nr:ChbG/HpnK family deacetylase [Thermoguttaceae bacterium]
MIPLVFNADDFGLSPSVNRSIAECARAGLMKSVSLFITHSAAEDALARLAAIDEPIGLGLHFCLTSGRAVSPPDAIPLLAVPDGRFRHGFLSLARLLCSSRRDEAIRQIRLEFDAQYNRFGELLPPTLKERVDHLDSHQHIHVFPPITSLLADAARRGRLTMRVPSEPLLSVGRLLRPPLLFHAKGYAKKRILDYYLAKSRSGGNFAAAPVYFGIIDSGRMNVSAVDAILRAFSKRGIPGKNRPIEINLHPWKTAGEENLVPEEASASDRAFARSCRREEEYDLLIKHAPQIQAQLLDLGIRASRFNSPG